MDIKNFAEEFEFLRNKLEKIATLIITNNAAEACFMIGCLHSVCHGHYQGLMKLYKMTNPQPETKEDEPAV